MQKLIFPLLCAAVLFNGCDNTQTENQDTFDLKGRVVEASSGNAVSGVNVILRSLDDTVRTTADGRFVFATRGGASETVIIEGAGINAVEKTLSTTPGRYDFGDISVTLHAQTLAYYPFDNGKNAEQGAPGVQLNFAVTHTTDRFGVSDAALDLSTEDAQARIENTPLFNFGSDRSFSISLWVRMPMPGSYPNGAHMPVVSKGEGWPFDLSYQGFDFAIGISGAGYYPTFGVGTDQGSYVTGPDNIPSQTLWHHYIVTVDRAEKRMKMYRDGDSVASNSHPALHGHMSNLSPIFIGGKTNSTSSFMSFPQFNGFVDDLRFFEGILTNADARLLYHERGY